MIDALQPYFDGHMLGNIQEITKFTGGYSNLSFLVETDKNQMVLRMPPKGSGEIKGGHNILREANILTALAAEEYTKVPEVYLCCEDESVLGSPFYLMQKLEGIIHGANMIEQVKGYSAKTNAAMTNALIDSLVGLHSLPIHGHLAGLGKPEGFIKRQVQGWTERYEKAKTDEIPAMEELTKWLGEHIPEEMPPSIIHNDYKFDNVVFSPDLSQINGILDWEMATLADRRMDLGAMLSYWCENGDGPFEKSFNITWLPGFGTRQQILDFYMNKAKIDLPNMLFFYVFGTFKNATIAQQIYSRFKKGYTSEPRFGQLIHGVKAFAKNGQNALNTNTI